LANQNKNHSIIYFQLDASEASADFLEQHVEKFNPTALPFKGATGVLNPIQRFNSDIVDVARNVTGHTPLKGHRAIT
jgi:hypothetical protein